MSRNDENPWPDFEPKPSPHEELFEADRRRLRHERALAWRERLEQRERRSAQNSSPPPGWPPAAA